jgi:hypothetical protein
VGSRPSARAFRVEAVGGAAVETALPVRPLDAPLLEPVAA